MISNDRPNLLFLSPRIPYPLNTGAKIRTHALLSAVLGRYIVHYAGFLQPEMSEYSAREALADCITVALYPERPVNPAGKALLALRTLRESQPAMITKYYNRALAVYVRQWISEHPNGIVHADHLHMAQYLGNQPTRLRIMDEHNVESQIVERLAAQHAGRPWHGYITSQANKMKAFEARMVASADLTLAVSEGDAVRLRAMAHGSQVEVVPNGVDLDYFAPNPRLLRREGKLVFTGSMNWLPNQDAVCWFMEEIWAQLDAQKPSAGHEPWRLDIVGHAPPPPVKALAGERVRVTGSVEDVRPYVHEARIFIAPIRVGGGSRLKLLEAFAMGIPVVSTAVGCEGLDVEHDRHLLIADSAGEFAAAVRRLHDDPALATRLSDNARRHVIERFGWKAIGKRMLELYEERISVSKVNVA